MLKQSYSLSKQMSIALKQTSRVYKQGPPRQFLGTAIPASSRGEGVPRPGGHGLAVDQEGGRKGGGLRRGANRSQNAPIATPR